MQTIQQLQQELAEAREQNSIYTEESGMAHANAKDATSYAPDKGNQFSVNESSMLNGGNSGILPNGNIDKVPPFVSPGNASIKVGLSVKCL